MESKIKRSKVLIAALLMICLLNIQAIHALPVQAELEKKNPAKILVSVDPRMELLSVIQYLSEYKGYRGMPLLTELEFPYKKDLVEAFAGHKEHTAVKLFKEMSTKHFWYGHPPKAMLYLTDPPELRLKSPVDDLTVKMAGGSDRLGKFYEQVRSFAVDTDFMSFYASRKEYYEVLAKDYLKLVDLNWLEDLERYHGYSQNSYNVILVPMSHGGGYGPRLETSDDVFDAYYIAGPRSVSDGDRLAFGDSVSAKYMIQHEFGHSFVNHLADANLESLLASCTVLQANKKEEIEKYGIEWRVHIADWVSEHINRAVHGRLVYNSEGEDAFKAHLEKQKRQGFSYVGEVCECLETYERKRTVYLQLRNYFPKLAEVFKKLAKDFETRAVKVQ